MEGDPCEWYVGVDEAGRGSVIGEMVVAAYAVKPSGLAALPELGVRDSKKLSSAERARLFHELKGYGAFAVAYSTPQEIDVYNLNTLTASKVKEAFSRLLRILGSECGEEGFTVKRVVVDKFGAASRVRWALEEAYGGPLTVIVEERADERWPEVSAASIIAKYVRDSRLQVLRDMYGVEGSGYPGDPHTLEWVRRAVERGYRPPIIRYSWYTLKKVGAGLAYKKKRDVISRRLDEFLEGE